jgi:predicted DNA-binding WGR domain protein
MGRQVKGVSSPANEGKVVLTTYLENTNPPHSKFYKIEKLRVDSENLFHVRCTYGKIGSSGSVVWHTILKGEWQADSVFNNLEYSKLHKGYKRKSPITTINSNETSKSKKVKIEDERFANLLENK